MSTSESAGFRGYPYGQSAMLALHDARNFAYVNGHKAIRTDDLLAGILYSGGCTIPLIRMELPPARLWRLLREDETREIILPGHEVCILGAETLAPSKLCEHIEKRTAHQIARMLNREEVNAECLLGGILMDERGLGGQVLRERGNVRLSQFFDVMGQHYTSEGSASDSF